MYLTEAKTPAPPWTPTQSRREGPVSCGPQGVSIPLPPYLPLSVAPEAARRLQGLQVAEVVLADGRQAFGNRRRLEAVGQVVQPFLVLGLQVHEGLDGIAPVLRPAAAVLRPSVVHARLLVLAAVAVALLSLGVAESHAFIVNRYVTRCQITDFLVFPLLMTGGFGGSAPQVNSGFAALAVPSFRSFRSIVERRERGVLRETLAAGLFHGSPPSLPLSLGRGRGRERVRPLIFGKLQRKTSGLTSLFVRAYVAICPGLRHS